MITHHNIIPAACAQQNERHHFHSGKIGQCPEERLCKKAIPGLRDAF